MLNFSLWWREKLPHTLGPRKPALEWKAVPENVTTCVHWSWTTLSNSKDALPPCSSPRILVCSSVQHPRQPARTTIQNSCGDTAHHSTVNFKRYEFCGVLFLQHITQFLSVNFVDGNFVGDWLTPLGKWRDSIVSW